MNLCGKIYLDRVQLEAGIKIKLSISRDNLFSPKKEKKKKVELLLTVKLRNENQTVNPDRVLNVSNYYRFLSLN